MGPWVIFNAFFIYSCIPHFSKVSLTFLIPNKINKEWMNEYGSVTALRSVQLAHLEMQGSAQSPMKVSDSVIPTWRQCPPFEEALRTDTGTKWSHCTPVITKALSWRGGGTTDKEEAHFLPVQKAASEAHWVLASEWKGPTLPGKWFCTRGRVTELLCLLFCLRLFPSLAQLTTCLKTCSEEPLVAADQGVGSCC